MPSLMHRAKIFVLPIGLVALAGWAMGQSKPNAKADLPQVVVKAAGEQLRPNRVASRVLYPWKTHVTCTVFWVGEKPTAANPVPNHMSSWDMNWVENFGGYDDPKESNRIADHATGEFRPKKFEPKMNPFYIALPYNDVSPTGVGYKPEASRVIPWFSRTHPIRKGLSVCKGRWVQIFHGGRSCYAQWEDCGPWLTTDWQFVFGTKPPKTTKNGSAGIDISPSVRDYLEIKSGEKVHWRFVEESQVPYGPWKKYGMDRSKEETADEEVQRKYLEYLRQLRNEQFGQAEEK